MQVIIDTVSGSVARLHPPFELCKVGDERCASYHVTVLDVLHDQALVSLSAPHLPPSVCCVTLQFLERDAVSVAHWSRVTPLSRPTDAIIAEKLQRVHTRLLLVPPTSFPTPSLPGSRKSLSDTQDSEAAFECIFVCPGGDAKLDAEAHQNPLTAIQNSPVEISTQPARSQLPLVLFIHGGPHSVIIIYCSYYYHYEYTILLFQAFDGAFSPEVACLVANGFAVCMVNYRGSLGFGLRSLHSLPGRIGQQDVNDCMDALKAAIGTGLVDEKRVGVMGGSHGGFLTCHLIAQFPTVFSVAIARNPVVSIGWNLAAGDIPDWCHTEVGTGVVMPHQGYYLPDGAQMSACFAASPVSLVGSVKTPVLLLLGSEDKRVPLGQSMEYYHLLRARGVETKLCIYPMGHSLASKVGPKANVWGNALVWLRKHLA